MTCDNTNNCILAFNDIRSSGNVTQVVVQAGTNVTHPDGAGDYSLTVPAGTYSVTASFVLLDAHGSEIGELQYQYFRSGNHQLPLSSIPGTEKMVQGFYLLELFGEDGFTRNCKIVYGGSNVTYDA